MSKNDSLKVVNELTSKGIERVASLGELNVRLFEKLAARQVDAITLYTDHAVRIFKLATEAKGYNEFFKGQADASKELSERVVAEGKATIQMVGEARDDYRAWFDKNTAEITADLRKNVAAA
ncbi:phasin family protein [Thiobaca trueperi]|uniref:Phasin protein n=1 Tax=Thiobaca trueperi TaxID=127458 RepID=A0A4R3N5B8_9GAMM|nr:phasin family protein [Thiobaca trueperi]TCT22303.1 phasin protein [Thiobaca trueperi]